MHLFYRIVLLLNWLVALLWLLRVLTWRRSLERVPDLTRSDREGGSGYDASGPLPLLTVVVPARNEGNKIAATLHSLLNSQGVALEVIAVDDRSQDQTGALMDEIAAGRGELVAEIDEIRPGKDDDDETAPADAASTAAAPPALRVLHIAELSAGWLGKTHAMALGARQASGEWLLFTDGDVVFRADALHRALAYAIASNAGHLVLLPTLLMESQGERMTMSFLQVMSLWPVRLWKVPDPKARDALGVGAFNLIRRETYDAIGGWEALRMNVVEDLALGLRVKHSGFAQRAVLGRGLVTVRWVEGAFGVVENLSKNLFAFFRFRAGLLLAFLPVFVLFTLFPYAALLAGKAAAPATAIMLLAVWLAYQRQARYQPFSVWQMLLFSAASLLILYTMVRSMAVVLWNGGITWRGTFYPLSELRGQAAKQSPRGRTPASH